MEEMQISSKLTWIEVQFMKKAVDEVEKCRTTLKWTYSMAYYLESGNQKELFEDNQRWVVFCLVGNIIFNVVVPAQGLGEGCRRLVRATREPDRARDYSDIETKGDG
jgi:hypothetical protein